MKFLPEPRAARDEPARPCHGAGVFVLLLLRARSRTAGLASRRRMLLASASLLALIVPGLALGQTSITARMSTGAADPASAAARAAQSQALQSAQAAQHAREAMGIFARAAETQAAMASLQAQARAAAAAATATVPNGLQPGGLVPQLDATWLGARAPVQGEGAAPGRVGVTVTQTQPRAIATWRSFNVGRETDLRFDQSAGGTRAREWAILNRVEDPAAEPSRILGSITAEGAVFVINRNGIIFGGSSQVNVASLFASALDVGGWNDPPELRNERFLNGLLTLPSGAGNYVPTFSHDRPEQLRDGAGNPRRITVEVEPGGRITLREEGTAVLAAPQVRNAGSIGGPAAQVILAAGAGLRLDAPPPASRAGPTIGFVAEALRGPPTLTTAVDPLGLNRYPFEARNAGLLSAPRGNITMTGFTVVNEPGAVLAATTANNRPGSITLTARDVGNLTSRQNVDPNATQPNDLTALGVYRFGELRLERGSLVQIGPEPGRDQVVFNTSAEPFQQGRIALTGLSVRFGEDAILRAPGARLRISGDLPERVFGANAVSGGRLQTLLLEPGAAVDLGGLKDLTAPVSRNFIQVATDLNTLRDSPLQRSGWLYSYFQGGGRVTIDTRRGSQIADWQPTAAGQPIPVAERLGIGGSIEIVAERSFAMAGSRIDVSGGLLTWQGGMRPAETRFQGADGRVYTIATAPRDAPLISLAGQWTHEQPRWGLRDSYGAGLVTTRPVFEPGYVEGFDAGSVTISGRFYGDGVIQGGGFAGLRQAVAARPNDGDPTTSTDLPAGGTLAFTAFRPVTNGANPGPLGRSAGIGGLVNPTFVETVSAPLPADLPGRLVAGPTSDALSRDRRQILLGEPLPAARFDTLLSTRDVINRGWSSVTIEGDGALTLPQGVSVSLAPGGRLALNAWNVSLLGSVRIPAGTVTATANAGARIPAVAETLAPPALFALRATGAPETAQDGVLEVGAGAVLSVAGRWVNDDRAVRAGELPQGSAFTAGGTITLQTRFSQWEAAPPLPAGAVVDPQATPVAGRPILLGAGSLLDVSAGGHQAPGAASAVGRRGGTLTLATYAGPAASPTGTVGGTPPSAPVTFYIAGAHARPLDFGAEFRGFGTGRTGGGSENGLGGTLAIAAPSMVFGRPASEAERATGTLEVDVARWAAAGFSDLRFTAPIAGTVPFAGLPAGSITLAAGAQIAPIAASRAFDGRTRFAPSGAEPAEWGVAAVLPRTDRGPTRLTFTAGSTLDLGDAATRITADPGGPRADGGPLISLSAPRPMTLRGTLEAPAGGIQVIGTGQPQAYALLQSGSDTIVRELDGTAFTPGTALWIADTARLLAPGLAETVPTANGRTAGVVRPGGAITLREGRGWLVVAPGALVDVSGAATGLAVSNGPLRPAGTLLLAGDAGSLDVGGARGLFLDGVLRGAPGGPGARGATLTLRTTTPPPGLTADNFAGNAPPADFSVPVNLTGFAGTVVRQQGPSLPAGLRPGDPMDPTLRRLGPIAWAGGEFTDRAFLTAETLEGSGFDRLYLAGFGSPLRFEGPVTLNLGRAVQIEASRIELAARPGGGAARAALATDYLALNGGTLSFSPQGELLAPTPTAPATGTLDLAARILDVVGAANFVGAGRVTLSAAEDLRLIGTRLDPLDAEFGRVLGGLTSQGDLVLRAGQVYPATGSSFAVLARGAAGEAGRTIRFERAGETPPAPLSAGAILTVTAANIEQAGVLRVPQGRLDLRAERRIDLLPGSLTSTSADGLTVPFGQIISANNALGVDIVTSTVRATGAATAVGMTAPPERVAEFTAPEIRVSPGAVVDASGGGELLAHRFIAGPGGSRDVLARGTLGTVGGALQVTGFQFADRRDVFAILPGAQPGAAPVSPFIADGGTSLGRGDVTALPGGQLNEYGQQIAGLLPTVGDAVRIAGVPGLPAGTYTLLPGRYAQLPGAFRVVLPPAPATPGLAPVATGPVQRPDGSWLVPAQRAVAGTGLLENAVRLAEISPAASWSQYSAITTRAATDHFTARAAQLEQLPPMLPVDAGRLTLTARTALVLEGATRFGRGPGGRGGQVEISGDRIAITPGGVAFTGAAEFLPVSDASLTALGAETLTIGGVRLQDPQGQRLDIRARAVTVAAGAAVTVPELVLMARAATPPSASDGLRVEAGAQLTAAGSILGGTGNLRLGRQGNPSAGIAPEPGDGTVLRLSAAAPARLLRDNVTPGEATGLAFGPGVLLTGNSLLLAPSGRGTLAPDLRIRVSSLELFGSSLVLGDAPPGAGGDGFALGRALLAGLAGTPDVTLRSRSTIDAHGAATLAAGNLRVEAGSLRGFDAAQLTLSAADTLTLANSDGALARAPAPAGGGAFRLEAGSAIRLGPGNLAVSGFGRSALATPGALVASGSGTLDLPGDLVVNAALVTGTPGADLTLRSAGFASFAPGPGAAPALPEPGLGGRIAIEAGSAIGVDTRFVLPGGTLELVAGAGDLRLGPTAVLDLSGRTRAFFDVTEYAPGGQVTLRATAGSVRLAPGAAVDVSAPAPGLAGSAAAGAIAFVAQQGGVEFAGASLLGAGPPGGGGGFTLDTGGAVALGALNETLGAGGFFGRRVVHSRAGDLALGAGVVFRGSEIGLTADGGAVRIAGTLDTTGPRGGRVALFGRDLVQLLPGAVIDARGTEAGRPGGTVEIGTRLGPIQMDGATIAVGGGDPFRGSLVRLRLPEAAVAASGFGANVTGARRVEVEPFRALAAGSLTQSGLGAAFASVAAANPRASVIPGRPGSWRVTPGLEVAVDGSLSLAQGLDLLGLRGPEGDPGVLTLRARGDLELLATVSDGFAAPAGSPPTTPFNRWLLQPGRSWSYRFVADADLASANPLATRDPGAAAGGSVLVGQPWRFNLTTFLDGTGPRNPPPTNPMAIRTGTGSIDVAAASDVLLRDPDAVVYTAGRPVDNANLVTRTRPDGTVETGYFYLPIAPSYTALDTVSAPLDSRLFYPATYPVEGGDLRLLARRDLRATILDEGGNNAGQTVNAWLFRQGMTTEDTGLFVFRPAIPAGSSLLQFPIAPGTLPALPARTSQTSWWVDFSRFRQNFGVLGGGDAEVRVGRDMQASVSIPTTGRVGGGLAPTYDFVYRARPVSNLPNFIWLEGAVPGGLGVGPKVAGVDGGGDLALNVGRNIGAGSQIFLGRGEAEIRAGGALLGQEVGNVEAPGASLRATSRVGSVLALGDARFRVVAGGGAAVTIYDPLTSAIQFVQGAADTWQFGGTTPLGSFSGFGPTSAVSVAALGGELRFLGEFQSEQSATVGAPVGPGVLGTLASAVRGGSRLAPRVLGQIQRPGIAETFGGALVPGLDGVAFSGDIVFQSTDAARLTSVALVQAPAQAGALRLLAAGSVIQPTLLLPDAAPTGSPTPLLPFGDPANARGVTLVRPPLPNPIPRPLPPQPEIFRNADNVTYRQASSPFPPGTGPQRATDADRALVYAVAGDIVRPVIGGSSFVTVQNGIARLETTGSVFAKRIGLRAGRDISDLSAIIQHATPGDISFIWAGRDLGTRPFADPLGLVVPSYFGHSAEVRGPGRLQIIAGRDIFGIRRSSNTEFPSLGAIAADNGLRATGNAANPAWAEGSATIDVLFGIGSPRGIDTQGFLERVLGAGNIAHPYRVELATQSNGSVTWVIQPDAPQATDAATRARIAALPTAERLALSTELLMRELAATGRAPASSLSGSPAGEYDRAYGAYAALFPDSPGWNAGARQLLGAPLYTGTFNLQSTFVRTEQGGGINVLGPGGDFLLGAITETADPFPDRIGVLTLGFGPISIATFGDIQVGQSRVVTADGGDILFWSSSADINAGLGARTARFVPPFQVSYLSDGTRVPNRAGLITGSGISTYTPLTALDQVASLRIPPTTPAEAAAQADEIRQRTAPGITLIAPIGTVDAGDAGIAAAGAITIAAQTVLNVANIAAGGGTTGVPVVQAPNVGGAVAAAAAAGAAAGTADQVARQAQSQPAAQAQPAVITVEVLGFGGSEAEAAGAPR